MNSLAIISLWFLFLTAIISVEAKADICSYQLVPESFQVKWTAFKTTSRTGVSGSFKNVEIDGAKTAESFEELLNGITVTINRRSVDMGDSLKETNLNNFFFDKLINEDFVGAIKSVNENDHTLTLSLTMNGQTQEIPMVYTHNHNGITKAEGKIDLLAFQAENALGFLNEKCRDLHKGSDGVSKTWPDVELDIQAEIKHECE